MNRSEALQRIAFEKQSSPRRVAIEHIGGPLYHTVDDRERMVRQLDTGFSQTHNESMLMMGWSPSSPNAQEKDPRWTWYRATAIPLLNEWERFRNDLLGSWWNRFTTNWDIIEGWQARLLGFRDLLKKKFDITVPDPAPLTQTMWQEAGDRMKSIGDGAAGMLSKILWVVGIAVVGGLAIALVFAFKGGGKTTALMLKGAGK